MHVHARVQSGTKHFGNLKDFKSSMTNISNLKHMEYSKNVYK